MTRKQICKVLVVDADPGFRRALRGYLEHHGYVVETADNAVDAIRRGLLFAPHVLVSGWHLAEETSGVRVAETLVRHVPALEVMLTTAAPVEELREQTDHLRLAALLAKPVAIGPLFELIEQAWARAGAARGAEAADPSAPNRENHAP